MKKKTLIRLLIIVLCLPIILFAVMSAMSKPPANLGVVDGQLASCPDSPNCVSTQAEDEEHGIDPIHYEGDTATVQQLLKESLSERPRTKIVTEKENYLHAEVTSLIFRFVDDVEFWIDEEHKLIHFRSASRVGRSDLGVNRKRMESLRQTINRKLDGLQ